MSFWSDSSPIVKAAIIIGAIGIPIALLFWTGVIGGGPETNHQQRGFQSAPQ